MILLRNSRFKGLESMGVVMAFVLTCEIESHAGAKKNSSQVGEQPTVAEFQEMGADLNTSMKSVRDLLAGGLAGSSSCPSRLNPSRLKTSKASLFDLVKRGDLTGVGQFLESPTSRRSPVDQRDSAGNTALYFALRQGDFEIADQLIKKGAQLTLRNGSGHSILAAALASGMPKEDKRALSFLKEFLSKLPKQGYLSEAEKKHVFELALIHGDLELASNFRSNLHDRFSSGKFPIEVVAEGLLKQENKTGYRNLLIQLLEKDVSLSPALRERLFQESIRQKDKGLLTTLLKERVQGRREMTPSTYQSVLAYMQKQAPELIPTLLAQLPVQQMPLSLLVSQFKSTGNKEYLSLIQNYGSWALHFHQGEQGNQKRQALEDLARSGFNLVSLSGTTLHPLASAAMNKDPATLQFLKEKGVSFETTDVSHHDALESMIKEDYEISKSDRIKAIQLMRQLGLNLQAPTSSSHRLWKEALKKGDADTLDLLERAGYQPPAVASDKPKAPVTPQQPVIAKAAGPMTLKALHADAEKFLADGRDSKRNVDEIPKAELKDFLIRHLDREVGVVGTRDATGKRSPTPAEIKKAWRKFILKIHPDKNPHATGDATEAFKLYGEIFKQYQKLEE